MKRALAVAAAVAAALAAGCGYHVAGRADLLPKHIQTIAIHAFGHATTRYRLTDRLPAALTHEFISRTRYQIVTDPKTADAVLEGAVVNYAANPVVFDPASGRASTVQISVVLQVTLRERATGNVLFSNPGLEVRERYEISVDQRAYLEESDVALERVSREVARRVVSAILEGF